MGHLDGKIPHRSSLAAVVVGGGGGGLRDAHCSDINRTQPLVWNDTAAGGRNRPDTHPECPRPHVTPCHTPGWRVRAKDPTPAPTTPVDRTTPDVRTMSYSTGTVRMGTCGPSPQTATRLGATEIPKPRCFIRNMSNGRRRMWARVLVPRSTRSGRIHDRPPGNTIPQFQRQCACTLSICNCCMLPCPATPLTLWRAWNFTRRPPNARRTEQWEVVRLLGG